MGRGDEAEKLLFEQLDQLLVDAQRGVTVPARRSRGVRTTRSSWRWPPPMVAGLTTSFVSHGGGADVCGSVVDELYTVLRQVKAVNLDGLA
jgi:hypothetical protein